MPVLDRRSNLYRQDMRRKQEQESPVHPQTGQSIRVNEDGSSHFACSSPATDGVRVLESANEYLVRSRSQGQAVAYSGTQAFFDLADACDILRDARRKALNPSAPTYDYTNQAWIVDGRYLNCSHPQDMNCGCFGRLHAGEVPAVGADIH